MEITQTVIIVVALLGAVLVGLVAIVPTLLEIPRGHDDVSDATRPTPTPLQPRKRHRHRPTPDAGGGHEQRWAA